MIYYITGGERSGKSSYAQELALKLSNSPVYLATARKWDGDFEKRIQRHINDRDERWTTIEEEKFLGDVDIDGKVVVLDCITLWITNWYVDTNNDVEECTQQVKQQLDKLFTKNATIIIISNEIGMGGHAETAVGRRFTEIQGRINQYIAKRANEATLMVSGLPLMLKST